MMLIIYGPTAKCPNGESGGDPTAISLPDYDGLRNYGGLQLHGDPGGLDPVYAVEEAHRKWLMLGYGAWGCW